MPRITTIALLMMASPFAVRGQAPEALVPTVCGLVDEEFFELISKPRDFCYCVADNDYNACTDAAFAADDPDGSVLCGVRQCQDYNWCFRAVPCADTIPPKDLLDCSTTVQHYNDFPPYPRLINRTGIPGEAFTDCLQDEALSEDFKNWRDIVDSLLGGIANVTVDCG